MYKPAFLLLAALASQPALAADLTIEEFLADPIELLDEQGKFQRELPANELPPPPLPVLQYNDNLEFVQVELANQKVWLDTQDLRLNQSKTVKLPCQKLPTSMTTDKQNNSTIGFGAGCQK